MKPKFKLGDVIRRRLIVGRMHEYIILDIIYELETPTYVLFAPRSNVHIQHWHVANCDVHCQVIK